MAFLRLMPVIADLGRFYNDKIPHKNQPRKEGATFKSLTMPVYLFFPQWATSASLPHTEPSNAALPTPFTQNSGPHFVPHAATCPWQSAEGGPLFPQLEMGISRVLPCRLA